MDGRLTTLCYLEQGDSYLMLHRVKKKNDLNQDKWVGIGGKFEGMETPEECLLREATEETGLTLTSYRLRGIVTFISDKWGGEYMFLYTADGWKGQQTVCDEGNLEWIRKADVYNLKLWEGDKIFFKLLDLNYPCFSLKLRYEGDTLMEAVLDGTDILADWEKEGVAWEPKNP